MCSMPADDICADMFGIDALVKLLVPGVATHAGSAASR
jgi:hypothetical protein